jgi:crotonobetainyl-CoA:carnitine CoA-transferase CaiB-like acyl-CoA transferase
MTKPMEGVRVLEVALYGFVPSAGAVLADWGADVVKIEHPETGDPVRGLVAWGVDPAETGISYLWEIFNRGKRSVGIDIAHPAGREALMKLVDQADVFLTNFLGPARQRLGIDADDVRTRNPRIIYARGTGHGPKGPDADKGGFDALTYWGRPGTGVAAMPPDYDYPIQLPGPAFGDIQSGAHLAGGVAAALYQRSKTGTGGVVDVSLLGSGMWAGQANIVGARLMDVDVLPSPDRRQPNNPVANMYRTGDGRFLNLGFLEADRYWAGFCTVVGHPELVDDERFATAELRAANVDACVALLDKLFDQHTLAEWENILGQQGGPFSTVQTPHEAAGDEQAKLNGYVQTVRYDSGAVLPLIAAPAQFDQEAAGLRPAPEHAADTDTVLLASGLTWDELMELKISGAIS